MKDDLTILKLGGSVITKKDEPLTPNLQAIKRLAEEISRADFKPLIIIHGGGSYGHPVAKKYRIPEGFKDDSQLLGVSETHEAMVTLNRLFVENFLKYNLPVFSLPPSSFFLTKKGRIQKFDERILRVTLTLGLIPVFYGDVVFDIERGFAILSGDQIASALAIRLNAKRIIMGIDVDGLYDSDPKKNPSARLLSDISLKDLANLMKHVGGSQGLDVTGGMLGKILELKAAVEHGVDALIVNAPSPDNIYKSLKGEDVVGTWIRR